MVRLYAVDASALAPRFDALLTQVDADRRARILQYGNTPAGRQCLGAGLLMARFVTSDGPADRLQKTVCGKPYLPGRQPFNLSHSGDYAVLSTADRAVGVDVERLRPIRALPLSTRFFHPEEQAFLHASANLQSDFFTIWTLKESYLKAEGCGFSRAPRTFAVLPDQSGGGVPNWDTDYRFFRYDDALPGCRLAVCSLDRTACKAVEWATF